MSELTVPLQTQGASTEIIVETLPLEVERLVNVGLAQSGDIKIAVGRRMIELAQAGKIDEQADICEVWATVWRDTDEVMATQVLAQAEEIGDNKRRTFEDLRLMEVSLGRWAIGGTHVITEIGAEGWNIHPAIFEAEFEDLLAGELPEPYVVEAIRMPSGELEEPHGKNMTPIGKQNLWLFRPDGDDNNHRLQVMRYDGVEAVHTQYIDLPTDLPWALHKLGTTGPPIWLNEREAIFPLHGMNIVDGVYIYAIGAARLVINDEGLLYIDHIDTTPLIHPDQFVNLTSDMEEAELHAERRVVYACALTEEHDEDGSRYVIMYVNVGDKKTVRVKVPMTMLTRDWVSQEAISHPLER
ncbi:MAG TPA: hypothetical protein VLG92_03505 [Candidatus Saccharimonadia bacterium]|nr:hypothetical protein [Candidatus Saccharimonadia bacterium]